MDFEIKALTPKDDDANMYLVNSVTTHIILKEKNFFLALSLIKAKVNTISRSTNLTESSR